jgi:hypothetical protein
MYVHPYYFMLSRRQIRERVVVLMMQHSHLRTILRIPYICMYVRALDGFNKYVDLNESNHSFAQPIRPFKQTALSNWKSYSASLIAMAAMSTRRLGI